MVHAQMRQLTSPRGIQPDRGGSQVHHALQPCARTLQVRSQQRMLVCPTIATCRSKIGASSPPAIPGTALPSPRRAAREMNTAACSGDARCEASHGHCQRQGNAHQTVRGPAETGQPRSRTDCSADPGIPQERLRPVVRCSVARAGLEWLRRFGSTRANAACDKSRRLSVRLSEPTRRQSASQQQSIPGATTCPR